MTSRPPVKTSSTVSKPSPLKAGPTTTTTASPVRPTTRTTSTSGTKVGGTLLSPADRERRPPSSSDNSGPSTPGSNTPGPNTPGVNTPAGSNSPDTRPRVAKPTSSSTSTPTPSTSSAPKFVDSKVAARNNALTAMGGVKVDVFVRIRPRQSIESHDPVVVATNDDHTQLILEDVMGKPASYTYDKVYGQDASQVELYDDAVAPIVEQVARGMSCCIFAYGQTGAGKTYTMRGDLSSDPEKHGIIQRSITNLFRRLGEHEYGDVKVKCSFLEIYNEELEDLFAARPKKDAVGKIPKSKLALMDDPERGTLCSGLTEVDVHELDQVMSLLAEAEKKCKFAETKMNKMSNRAHRIFTIVCTFRRYEKEVVSTLTFVDLAGSEDISKSGATGLTAREASHINKSLLTLGRVINALACNEKHIPYRDSKLTRLLSEALGGVCKTSFIACVSPCGSSTTETSSTLRYAERAMEALNISQLPKWKQDEIMIDGLTRRVQMLMDDLENQSRIHEEIVTELQSEKAALVEENTNLGNQIWRAKTVIERLQARKLQLKTGLKAMTKQRDLQLSQKESLQVELLKTRKERDGYLADRKSLDSVLDGVRKMRERLLSAHRLTEGALTKDANTLKRTIEGAIKDIDELHTEVARKKALSVANEKLADDFRDRLSLKLRTLVQSIFDFNADQSESHSLIQKAVSEIKSTRQKETGTLRTDTAKFATSMNDLLAEVMKHAKEAELAAQNRLSHMRDGAMGHHEKVTVALGHLRSNFDSQMSHIQSELSNLDSSLLSWSDQIQRKLSDVIDSASTFAHSIDGHATSLVAHVQSTLSFQTARFSSHSAALEKHLSSERKIMAEESQKLIEDLSHFVSTKIQHFSLNAVQRTELAVSDFKMKVDEVSSSAKHDADHQVSELRKMQHNTQEWKTSVVESLEAGKRDSTANHTAGASVLENLVSLNEENTSSNTKQANDIETLESTNLKGFEQAVKDSLAANNAATATLEKTTNKGLQDVKNASEGIRGTAQTNLDGFIKSNEGLDKQLKHTLEHVKLSTDSHDAQLADVQKDVSKYVNTDLKRDVGHAPEKKKYPTPAKFPATEVYDSILKDVGSDWNREARLAKGEIVPGKGVDYPGDLGADDLAGLLTSTKTKDPQPADLASIKDAAHESDEEDYVVTEDAPQQNGAFSDEEGDDTALEN